MDLPGLIRRSRTSPLARWWMNALLRWRIPFNGPHGLRAEPMKPGGMRVHVPFWRINRNHIRGIHACALATAAEFCSGLALLEHLDPRKYRLIMKSLSMEYHFQAKTYAWAEAVPGALEIQDRVIRPLEGGDAVLYASAVLLHDRDGNHLATGTITWQVKRWDRVRTRV